MSSEKELCLRLMQADRISAVEEILREAGYWDSLGAWRYLGDHESNYSSIGNQQAEAVAALIEKIVNSVDARLLNACLEAGIDPTGPHAPASIREAVARFFEGKQSFDPGRDGKISQWLNEEATAQGRMITVTATGDAPSDGSPSISVADQGEGQPPDAFPDTFLSLHKANKLRVPFVQGKFNMGGTGALQFAGPPHRFQLIVSRRNPRLVNSSDPRDSEWGFTIVRREPPSEGRRNPVFSYLAPVGINDGRDGDVLSFQADSMPIFPESTRQHRGAFLRGATHGTLVKLYEYEWQGPKSNIVSTKNGLLRRIDLGMPEIALPVRVFEARENYRGHSGSFSTNVLGLASRLERDRAGKLEDGFPLLSVINLGGARMYVRIYAFNDAEAAKDYRTPSHGVVFSVNGQAHATYSTDFFQRKSVGMSWLADSLLVMVDCTEVDGDVRADLFMNSRDRLRSNTLSRQLEEELVETLSSDPSLRELRTRRRQEELDAKLDESKPLADALRNLIRMDPNLAKLLLDGSNLPSPFPKVGLGERGIGGEFKGQMYPTFFRIKGLDDGEPLTRDAEIGRKVIVPFETDAEDSYFGRDMDPGTIRVALIEAGGDTLLEHWSMKGPKDGSTTLSLELPDDLLAGEVLDISVEVTDSMRIDPFRNRIYLTMIEKHEAKSGRQGTRRMGATGGSGSTGTSGDLALPEIIEVTQDEWAEKGFDEHTAVVVHHAGSSRDAGESYDFLVNVDNKHLRLVQKSSKEDPKVLRAKFVYALVLIGLSIIRHEPARGEGEDEAGKDAPNVEETVKNTTRAVASVVLPLVKLIGELSDEDLDG